MIDMRMFILDGDEDEITEADIAEVCFMDELAASEDATIEDFDLENEECN